MSTESVIVINRSEITAGTRGASLGPEAILTAARMQGKSFFGDYPIDEIKHVNHLLDQPTAYPYAKRIDGLLAIYKSLNDKISQLLLHDKMPLVLAGDHGSAGGTIAGIKTAFPTKKIGVVWIDAHADIHTPYTTPSGNMHGMPIATMLGIDNVENGVNNPDEGTLQLWNQLKMIGEQTPKIAAEDLVYIAVRDTEVQENQLIADLGIQNYSVDILREKGISTVYEEIVTKLQDCDLLYVSFDVDSMDPEATSHGTGTPVNHGIVPKEAEEILTLFAQNKKTVCFEFVEVNPCLDEKSNKMAEITSQLVEKVLETLAKR